MTLPVREAHVEQRVALLDRIGGHDLGLDPADRDDLGIEVVGHDLDQAGLLEAVHDRAVDTPTAELGGQFVDARGAVTP